MNETVFVDASINLCSCCLSSDRKLKEISDPKLLKCLYKLLDRLMVPKLVMICWECSAFLVKAVKFCEKFQTALHHLSKVIDEQKIPTMTSLKLSSVEVIEVDSSVDSKMFTVMWRPEIIKIYKNEKDIQCCDDGVLENVIKSDDNFSDSDNVPLSKFVVFKADCKDTKYCGDRKKILKKEKLLKPRKSQEKQAGVVTNPKITKKLQKLNILGQVEMVYLSWTEVEKERLRLISLPKFVEAKFNCSKCALSFSHKDKFERHMKKHDNQDNNDDSVCKYCWVRCKDIRALSAHTRRHRVRWRCTECNSLFSRAGVAADHSRTHTNNVQHIHSCRQCGFEAPSFNALRKHIRKDHGVPQKCDICYKMYPDKMALKSHMFIHTGSKEHACPKCKKMFLFKNTMLNHLATHDDSKPYYCHECEMNFKTPACYKQHMAYSLKHVSPHNIKHICPECGKRFVQKSRLQEHRNAVHLKITPISCPKADCTYVCASKTVLRSHNRLVHKNARILKNYVCHKCGITYSSKNCLDNHIKKHDKQINEKRTEE